MGNLHNDLKGNVENILRSSQTVIQNYKTPEWKSISGTSPQQLDAGFEFCQEIMTVFNKYEKDIGVSPPQLAHGRT
jgi:hypothetical protein